VEQSTYATEEIVRMYCGDQLEKFQLINIKNVDEMGVFFL